MADFVLDASVTIRWAVSDGSQTDQSYADHVLSALAHTTAVVPALWYTELTHVLRGYEDRGTLGETEIAEFCYQLGQLPIRMDTVAPAAMQTAVIAVSRQFKLSGYDAQYLELAKRCNLPLATLDKDLRKAAKKADVMIYLFPLPN